MELKKYLLISSLVLVAGSSQAQIKCDLMMGLIQQPKAQANSQVSTLEKWKNFLFQKKKSKFTAIAFEQGVLSKDSYLTRIHINHLLESLNVLADKQSFNEVVSLLESDRDKLDARTLIALDYVKLELNKASQRLPEESFSDFRFNKISIKNDTYLKSIHMEALLAALSSKENLTRQDMSLIIKILDFHPEKISTELQLQLNQAKNALAKVETQRPTLTYAKTPIKFKEGIFENEPYLKSIGMNSLCELLNRLSLERDSLSRLIELLKEHSSELSYDLRSQMDYIDSQLNN